MKATGQSPLFTFFSKKPKPANNAPAVAACPPSNPPPSTLGLNTKLMVWWPADSEWYPCKISKRLDDGKVKLLYEDEDTEVVRLENEVWKLYDNSSKSSGYFEETVIEEGAGGKRSGDGEDEEKIGAAAKRHRIFESDESLMDGGCDFDDSEEEEEEEEESIDEKEEFAPTQNPVKLTRPTPTDLSSGLIHRALPKKDLVNPPGTHLHNHLSFFYNRKDLNGFASNHPDFSDFNLKIDYKELESMCQTLGTKLTGFQVQWWEIKSQYANCILLFKNGLLYEIFHDDADIAHRVLDTSYQKGVLAHTSFSESSYQNFLEKLVNAGYRVARVVQTETQEQFKERKKISEENEPGVLAREVCCVATRGTM
jgi:hypothetical protein